MVPQKKRSNPKLECETAYLLFVISFEISLKYDPLTLWKQTRSIRTMQPLQGPVRRVPAVLLGVIEGCFSSLS